MTTDILPCCGEQCVRVPEKEVAYRLDGMVVVTVGIHQEWHRGVTQCVINVATGRRYDVEWLSFWNRAASGAIPEVDGMEVVANAADSATPETGPEEHG